MNFLEKELEDWICREGLEVRGVIPGFDHELEQAFILGRQVRVPTGVIDILGAVVNQYDTVELLVIELKAVPINSDAVLQAARYARDIRKIFQSDHPMPGITRGKCECPTDHYVEVGGLNGSVSFYGGVRAIVVGMEFHGWTLLPESDAAGVELVTVEPSFQFSPNWRITEEKASEMLSIQQKSATQLSEMLVTMAAKILPEKNEAEAAL